MSEECKDKEFPDTFVMDGMIANSVFQKRTGFQTESLDVLFHMDGWNIIQNQTKHQD